MKNKFGILIAFISVSIIIALNVYNNKISDEKVLINGFNTSKASLKNININYWGKVNSKFMNCKKLKLISLQALKTIKSSNLKYNIKYLQTKDKNRTVLKLKCNLMIIAESTKSNGKSSTYLTVDEDLNKNIDKVINENNSIKSVFDRYKNKYIPTICFMGFFNGKISKDSMKSCEYNMLKVMDGVEINKTKGAGFTSIIAYTPRIKSNIKNIKKSNINIAYSYDETNNKTLMWLATPIIMNGY